METAFVLGTDQEMTFSFLGEAGCRLLKISARDPQRSLAASHVLSRNCGVLQVREAYAFHTIISSTVSSPTNEDFAEIKERNSDETKAMEHMHCLS